MNIKLLVILSLMGSSGAFAADAIKADFDGPVFGSVIENKAVYFESTAQLQQRMTAGDLTSVALVTHMLQRIEALNHKGPQLNAVIEINPDALDIATTLDEERAAGQVRGLLHGIPVLIKDNLDTADKMQTTAGSLALAGLPASSDAFVVQRLREAGAVILAKANMSEWSNFRGNNVPNGWSGRGGQTRNPHNPKADPCGSSSGSAVGVAAGFAPVSVGTETNGSIICPSSMNGVVGVRPTLGLLSRSGVIPISSRQDTPGPIARTVTDAAIMLNAMSGTDARDKATYRVPEDPVDYLGHLRRDALQGARLGYPVTKSDGSYLDDDPAFIDMKRVLRSSGATLVAVKVPPIRRHLEWFLLQLDFRRELEAYLQTRSGLPVKTLEDIVAFNIKTPGHENHDQKNLIEASSLTLSQGSYIAAVEETQGYHRTLIDELLHTYSLDALIDWSSSSLGHVGAVAGYPGVSIPVGSGPQGLPTGLYFLGAPWAEARLLSFAYAVEQVLISNALVR